MKKVNLKKPFTGCRHRKYRETIPFSEIKKC